MHYGWPSPSLPQLLSQNSTMTVTDSEGSWIAVMMLAGGPVGSIIAGSMIDMLGRKRTILLTAVPFFTSWMMIAFAHMVEIFYVARFVAGVADGITFIVVPMYLGEIADPKIRGLLGSSCSVIMTFGILLVNIMGTQIDIRLSALISSIVPVLLLVTFCWMPESPYYLLMRGRKEEARQNLLMLRGTKDVEDELDRLTNAISVQTGGWYWDLFKERNNRKALLVVIILRTVQQLSGVTAITFYATMIFAAAGSDISPNMATVMYFSVQILMTVVSALMLDKAGRRPLLLVSLTGCAIALTMEATYYCLDLKINALPVAALVVFIITYCLGLGTVPVLMLGELFPTKVKTFALCIVEVYYCLLAAVSSKFFQIMKDDFEMFIPFYVFALCCAIGFVLVFVFVPETKGKTLEDIQVYLKGNEQRHDMKSNSVQITYC